MNIRSDLATNIEQLIQQDPGNRGLKQWAIDGNLLPGTTSLTTGEHIIIATGFYILSAGEIETDGPPGAIILADALIKSGKSVTILTDDHSKEIMQMGLASIDCTAKLVTCPVDKPIEYGDIIQENTTHFVALERPGLADDGYHHNFRGDIISNFVAPVDEIYQQCEGLGITTIAIGDGGNELGMGNVQQNNPFSCNIESDYCICAGVSNWAGYALAGLLSIKADKNLMPEYNRFDCLLNSIVDAGAVDGVSGKQETTVDGLEREWEDRIYNSIMDLVKG